ncbi:MAG: hypothetical protein ACKOA8_10815 [Deltaproteobacteria bacterium]
MKNNYSLKFLILVIVIGAIVFFVNHTPKVVRKTSDTASQESTPKTLDKSVKKSPERKVASIPEKSYQDVLAAMPEEQKDKIVLNVLNRLKKPELKLNLGQTSQNIIDRYLRTDESRRFEKSFSQDSRSYRSLPGIVALPQNNIPGGIPQSSQVLKFLNHTLIKTDDPEVSENGLPVVFDTERGTLALVTGNLTISYRGPLDPVIASNSNIKIIQNFPQLGMATFSATTKDIGQLTQLVGTLRKNPKVRQVNLELKDHINVPQ